MDKTKRTFRLIDMTMDCYQLEHKVRDYKQMLDKATAIQAVSNEYSILEGVAENMYQKSVDGFENIKDFIKTLDAAYDEVPEEEEEEEEEEEDE